MPRILIAAILVLGTAFALPATAAEFRAGDISVKDPWARASIGTSRPGAAFVGIRNAGAEADRLTGVESPVAGHADLHRTSMVDGVMKMEPSGPVAVPAGGMVMMEPGGYHIMLMKLKTPLEEGTTFPLTLTFERAGAVTVEVSVMGPGAMGGGHGHDSGD